MKKNSFTINDYYSATIDRRRDLVNLRKNQQSIILSVYCAGLAVECLLRAYITKYTHEFDWELYSNTFNNAETEIKIDLMNRYDNLSEKETLYGNSNRFSYVYSEAQLLKPLLKKDLQFTEKEITMITNGLSRLDKFKIRNEIQTAMEVSFLLNRLKSMNDTLPSDM